MRKWAATGVLIVLLTVFRSLNLCMVALLGLAPFLRLSWIGAWIRDMRRD